MLAEAGLERGLKMVTIGSARTEIIGAGEAIVDPLIGLEGVRLM